MFSELKVQLKICFPVCTQNLMKRSVDVITLMTVGHLGPHAMSAAGLATVTSNVFGNSFIMGLVGYIFLNEFVSNALAGRAFVYNMQSGKWGKRFIHTPTYASKSFRHANRDVHMCIIIVVV